MIQLRVEWQQAPGVRDRALARTWARLQIEVAGNVVTQRIDPGSTRVRRGVYYSVLPLAQWVVANWWFLLNEPYRFPRILESRALAQNSLDRQWVRRHSLLTAREGGALPDLTLFRDGSRVVARWFADDDRTAQTPLHFIGKGEAEMSPTTVEDALARFIEAVITRLDGLDVPEVRELREDWRETLATSSPHRTVCEWAGQLGLDPYDPEELTDGLVGTLEGSVAALDEEARADLLDAEEPKYLNTDLRWLGDVRQAAASAGRPDRTEPETPASDDARVHWAGYQNAKDLRRALGANQFAPTPDLDRMLVALGWAQEPHRQTESEPEGPLNAAIERSEDGAAVAITPRALASEQTRFSTARAMWLRHFGGAPHARRLITGAHTWNQRASRAFAAEFLAPADGIRREVGGSISATEIDQLADHYTVSPSAIRHQVENHHIGWLAAY